MLKVTRSILVVMMLSVGGLGFADPSSDVNDGGPLIQIPIEFTQAANILF